MRKLKLAVAILCLAFTMTNSSPARTDQHFDEFSGFNCEEMKARFDNFTIALMREPDSKGYVIIYGGKYGRRGETQAWINASREYLSETRGVAKNRLTIVNGGYREQIAMQLWIIPKGASPPAATPTVQAKDVRFKKGRALKQVCTDE